MPCLVRLKVLFIMQYVCEEIRILFVDLKIGNLKHRSFAALDEATNSYEVTGGSNQ